MREKLDIVIIISFGLVLTLLVIFYVSLRGDMTMLNEKDGFWDFTNWVSIIVTIGASVTIAVAILIYTKTEQDKTTEIIKKQNSTRKKKRDFATQKISLLLTIIDEILNEKTPDYGDAQQYFNKIINTIGFFSESLESKETQSILELSEIGEIMCKNKGVFPWQINRTLPFTTNSVPANLTTLRQLIQENLDLLIEKNKKQKCFCGNTIPCSIHLNES